MAIINDRVHTLLLPIGDHALLVPSALVAEVSLLPEILPQPLSPPWVAGVLNWRSRPVTLCDLTRLWSPGIIAGPRSRIAVFYPLAGRAPWEFFALLTSAEPQPHTLDDAGTLLTNADNENPYFAATLVLDRRAVAIPDLGALARLFYGGATDRPGPT
ncbi:MAG: chemotaxis protein CheW [Acidiferrobacter sp.]